MPLNIPAHITAFLNALPTYGEPQEQMVALRTALGNLLDDVDRVSISVNMHCDIDDPENYHPDMSVTQFTPQAQTRIPDPTTIVREKDTDPQEFLEDLRQQGFPVDTYHPPVRFDYFFGGHAFLGTILLWRECDNPPVSRTTVDAMVELEPFMVYVLSDLVLRHKRTEPLVGVFDSAVEHLTGEAGLSKTELRVVLLILLGHSYKDMAGMLDVTMDTVKYHLKMIYRKTGTRSASELFAKYFTPRLNLPTTDR